MTEPAKAKDTAIRVGRVLGYVDAIEQNRVFGWAWEPDAPSVRLEIEVRCEDRVLATGVADRMRPDLVENRIGDGEHAFEIAIESGVDGLSAEKIEVFAKSSAGQLVPLGRRKAADREPGDPATLRRIAQALSALGAEQRKLVHATERKLAVIETKASDGTSDETVATVEAALAEVRAAQEKLEQRMGEFDVFLMRFDATLRELDEKISDLRRGSRMSQAGWWAIGAAVLVLVAVGAGVVLMH